MSNSPFGFPRTARITRGAELQRIAREGKRIRTEHLEVRSASPLARPEGARTGMCVGLIVPRFKHSAVDRNQLKRRLRELVRIQLLPTAIPIDLVIRIKPVAYVATFAMLEREVLRARDQLAEWHARQGAQDPPSGDTL